MLQSFGFFRLMERQSRKASWGREQVLKKKQKHSEKMIVSGGGDDGACGGQDNPICDKLKKTESGW